MLHFSECEINCIFLGSLSPTERWSLAGNAGPLYSSAFLRLCPHTYRPSLCILAWSKTVLFSARYGGLCTEMKGLSYPSSPCFLVLWWRFYISLEGFTIFLPRMSYNFLPWLLSELPYLCSCLSFLLEIILWVPVFLPLLCATRKLYASMDLPLITFWGGG